MKLGYIKVAKGVKRGFGTDRPQTYGRGYGCGGPRGGMGFQLCEALHIPCVDLNAEEALKAATSQIVGQVVTSPGGTKIITTTAQEGFDVRLGRWIRTNPVAFGGVIVGTAGLIYLVARGLSK